MLGVVSVFAGPYTIERLYKLGVQRALHQRLLSGTRVHQDSAQCMVEVLCDALPFGLCVAMQGYAWVALLSRGTDQPRRITVPRSVPLIVFSLVGVLVKEQRYGVHKKVGQHTHHLNSDRTIHALLFLHARLLSEELMCATIVRLHHAGRAAVVTRILQMDNTSGPSDYKLCWMPTLSCFRNVYVYTKIDDKPISCSYMHVRLQPWFVVVSSGAAWLCTSKVVFCRWYMTNVQLPARPLFGMASQEIVVALAGLALPHVSTCMVVVMGEVYIPAVCVLVVATRWDSATQLGALGTAYRWDGLQAGQSEIRWPPIADRCMHAWMAMCGYISCPAYDARAPSANALPSQTHGMGVSRSGLLYALLHLHSMHHLGVCGVACVFAAVWLFLQRLMPIRVHNFHLFAMHTCCHCYVMGHIRLQPEQCRGELCGCPTSMQHTCSQLN